MGLTDTTRSGRRTPLLWLLLLANYGLAFVLCGGFVSGDALRAPASAAWIAAVWLTYPLFYLLPAFALGWLVLRAAGRAGSPALRALAWLPALVAFATVQLALCADLRLHALYGFHLDGFVWNLLTTPGGVASMGAGSDTVGAAAGVAAALLVAEAGLLVVLHRGRETLSFLCRPRVAAVLLGVVAVLSVGERLDYAMAGIRNDATLLQWGDAFPLYVPLSLTRVARRMGWSVERRPRIAMALHGGHDAYPLRPLAFRPDAPRWNVVVLCSESLRADALVPDGMPATWRFAAGATRFTQHVSGGNGTRMGVFGLFYGLPGPYWFRFLDEGRGPVLVRALLDRGYEVRGYTSDDFTYPEFDRTVFADVERSQLSEGGQGYGWQRDREQVGHVLDFLARRDPARPFLLYMFFESPHAPYRFPPETAVRTPYLPELDYVTMDLQRDIGKIRNRYWNSVRHLDTQIERVLAALREQELLDSTIVVVTGDHGEEFLEAGRWGHNSQFSEEQIRVPFVLSAPGLAPAVVDRLTSHLDVPATLLSLLGATNPASDYSLGQDLLEPRADDYVLVSDWSRVAYVDAQGKAIFPTTPVAWFRQQAADRADRPLADPAAFLGARTALFARVLHDLGRFTRGDGGPARPPETALAHHPS